MCLYNYVHVTEYKQLIWHVTAVLYTSITYDQTLHHYAKNMLKKKEVVNDRES